MLPQASDPISRTLTLINVASESGLRPILLSKQHFPKFLGVSMACSLLAGYIAMNQILDWREEVSGMHYRCMR